MKHTYILLFVFFALITSESYSQYSISPRLGEEIDSYEREYFGLFPNINGFKSARTNLLKDSVVEFVITRLQNGLTSDTTFKINSTVSNFLVKYIEDFELSRRKKSTELLDLLNGIAGKGPAIENRLNKGRDVIINTLSGENLKGRLLSAFDSSVVIWQIKQQYNWVTLQQTGRSVRFSEINNITLLRKGYFWRGIAFGAIPGALIGAVVAGIMAINNNRSQSSDHNIDWYKSHGGIPSFDVVLVMSIGIGAVIGVLAGGITGGIIGAILDTKTYREVGGNADKYHSLLPQLNENSVYSAYPPPELIKFINK